MFIKNYASLAPPLTKLLMKDNFQLYTTTYNTNIKMTQFEAPMAWNHPHYSLNIQIINNDLPTVVSLLHQRNKVLIQLEQNLLKAQARMKKMLMKND